MDDQGVAMLTKTSMFCYFVLLVLLSLSQKEWYDSINKGNLDIVLLKIDMIQLTKGNRTYSLSDFRDVISILKLELFYLKTK